MDYCTYHPLTPATFSCKNCYTHHCDDCVDEGDRGEDPVCFNCTRPVEHLGAVNRATPFWRRLEESFRYPLKIHSLTLILSVSFLSAVLSNVPFAFVWMLIASGIFLKYSFTCLESTAGGLLVPPDVSEAYSGGLRILLHLFLLMVIAGAGLTFIARSLGFQFAGAAAVLMIGAMPAVVIVYALTDSFVEALNPANLVRLISAIGLPYGLLLAFIMIMSASVGVISQLLAGHYSVLSTILQSAVGNYYTVVMFHIMGYVIFQYQGSLGFAAREDFGEEKQPRAPRERLAAKLDIRLKDGDYNGVVELLEAALKHFPDDRDFNRQYFEFFHATGRKLDFAASRYLNYLIRSGQDHQLVIVFKRVLHLLPNYRPDSAEVRHQLAQACRDGGDSLSAAKLLKGLHLDFPDYPRLVQAYELMAEALEDLPNHAEQAKKCREFTRKFARLKAQETKEKRGPAESAKRAADQQIATKPEDEEHANRELPPLEFK